MNDIKITEFTVSAPYSGSEFSADFISHPDPDEDGKHLGKIKNEDTSSIKRKENTPDAENAFPENISIHASFQADSEEEIKAMAPDEFIGILDTLYLRQELNDKIKNALDDKKRQKKRSEEPRKDDRKNRSR